MFDWSRLYPWFVYLLAALASVAAIALARRLAISERLRNWALFAPRLVVLAILLVVLLNPVRREEFRLPSQPPHFDCLIDASRSMSLDQPQSRALRVQQVIGEADRALPATDRPRIQLYRFGTQLASIPDLGQLRSIDGNSRLADALERLPSRFGRELPRGILVFSDGAIDDAERLDEVAEAFRRIEVPVHVFPVGDMHVRGDVAIDELVVPPRVDVGTKVTVRGVVRGTGYAGERVVLTIRPADRPQVAPLVELPLTLAESAQPFEAVVEADRDIGELVVEVPVLAGEATDRNNRVAFQLASSRRKLRVIYMEGTGGTEYQWVHDALQEDKDIECVSMVADHQYVERPRLLRIGDVQRGFPATREELLQHDCVICSDISLGAFTREQLQWTVELVAERGGGFAMVGGITSFGAGGWDQTVWDQLIPVDMTGGNLGRGWLYHSFHIRVPDEAYSHPIWRIVEDPEQNRRIIGAMPIFFGTNYIQRLKPAATVLAYSAEPIPQVGIMPVFAAQPYGRGRTFAFSPDTTADWGRDFESKWGEGDNRYFRRFWRNLVRWLCENSINSGKRVCVETDKVIYSAGQPIELSAHAYDEHRQETVEYELTAEIKGIGPAGTDAGTPAVLMTAASSGKSYSAQFDSTRLADAVDAAAANSAALTTRTIEVVARHQGKEIGRDTIKVQILPELHELLQPKPRPEPLERLAQATGGKVLRSSGELTGLLRELPSTPGESLVSSQPLWDRPWLWGAIVILLAIEWILRRLAGYG
jgi:uncharacterized membrane protein